MINNTISRMFMAALIASIAVSFAAVPAIAQEPEVELGERIEAFEQRLEEVRERLDLSDEQIDQLIPILREGFDSTRAVLEANGISAESMGEERSKRQLNLREFRALVRDLDKFREVMYDKIERADFLSDEQFAEFKKIQEEQREALRERLRERRGRR